MPVAHFPRAAEELVIGEGAAIMIIETMENAIRRGANILGEITGFGMNADAKDIVHPDDAGMACAMNIALEDAQLAPDDIQYINAHGTGTVTNDATEVKALKRIFGDRARTLPISSTKSMIGHALGSSGALEMVATLMGMRESISPPTIGYLGPDPECDIDCVPNEARPLRIENALSNSFAFGGLNAVLALRRCPRMRLGS